MLAFATGVVCSLTFAQRLQRPTLMFSRSIIARSLIFLTLTCVASAYPRPLNENDEGSRPKPGPYRNVWLSFYNAGSEVAIAPALIAGGRKMVPHICRAVRDSRMHCRRYAIGALGHLRDRRALLTLETIYADTDEDSLFRGDALEAIFVIDQDLGRSYARNVLAKKLADNDFLLATARRVFDESTLMLTLPDPNDN